MVIEQSDKSRSSSSPDLIISLTSEYGNVYVPDTQGERKTWFWNSGNNETNPECTAIATQVDDSAHKITRTVEVRYNAKKRAQDAALSWDTRTVRHIMFREWPILGIPEEGARASLVELARDIQDYKKGGLSNSPIIHCGAGCGRTGTFIAMIWLLSCLDEGDLDKISGDMDPIYAVVSYLREQRTHMVESREQFKFLYDVVREEWLARKIAQRIMEENTLKIARHWGERLRDESLLDTQQPSSNTHQVLGPYKFTHEQLEMEGVIQNSNVSEIRRENIYFIFWCPKPGSFNIYLDYKGRSRSLSEVSLELSHLLKMEKNNREVVDIGYAQFNVTKLLVFLYRQFS